MKLGSLFDGSGGFPLAGALNGVEPVWCSEVEPYPIAVTRSRFPSMKHYGDVSKVNGTEVEPVDIITFGSPCFVAGTVILTEKGYTPIEDVSVGDFVLTHTGTMRKVTAVGSKLDSTILLRGNHFGVETTNEHPFYCAGVERKYPMKPDGKRTSVKTLSTERSWVKAKDMRGKQWATPNTFPQKEVPVPLPTSAKQHAFPAVSEALFYFVGRWLGDGWTRTSQRAGRPEGQNEGRVYLCDSTDKKEELRTALSFLGVPIGHEVRDGCVKAYVTHQLLAQWLKNWFGSGAKNKNLPCWVFGMEKCYRKALLDGMFDSDGYRKDLRHCRVSTISRPLAFGIRALAESLGEYTTAIHLTTPEKTKLICGRLVFQSEYYTVAVTKRGNGRNTVLRDDLHSWYRCREVIPTEEIKRVYNLSVDTDESYVADGVVVHNCQDLSIAGKREGIEDGARSSLFFQAVRIIKEMRETTDGKYPRFAVWENVPGAFSSNKGNDFRLVLEALANVSEPEISIPMPEKWQRAGEIVGNGWSIAWRTLDAQYWGVPQRRKRIYLVADFGGERAGQILFERESVCGDTAQGREAGEGVTYDAERSVGGSCGAFCAGASPLARSIGYSELVSPTLKSANAGLSMHAVVYPQVARTLEARHDSSPCIDRGQNVVCYALKGNGIDRADTAGCNGCGWREDQSYTLNTIDRPAVAYSVDCRNLHLNEELSSTLQAKENGGQSLNYQNPVVYPTVTGTLCASGAGTQRPAGQANEADMCVVTYQEKSGALCANSHPGSYTGQDAYNDMLVAGLSPKPPRKYIVRRLTPTECARLQGFPATWGDLAPYDGDDAFWQSVYKTACEIKGTTFTPKKDLRKWYNGLHTDSAEYRMWGNAIALPCAEFVLRSIVDEMTPYAWL